MEYHAWRLTTHDGEVFEGIDNYPAPDLKARARMLELQVAGQDFSHAVNILEGETVLLVRRCQIHLDINGKELSRNHKYILGIVGGETEEIVP